MEDIKDVVGSLELGRKVMKQIGLPVWCPSPDPSITSRCRLSLENSRRRLIDFLPVKVEAELAHD
jgi:hypothetical protein